MRFPECNHKVTGNSYEAVDGCEAIDHGLLDYLSNLVVHA